MEGRDRSSSFLDAVVVLVNCGCYRNYAIGWSDLLLEEEKAVILGILSRHTLKSGKDFTDSNENHIDVS